MGVFSKEHNPETSIKRNTFPQSFCNNLTFNFGNIVPFACFETMSGDTFELQTAFGLRFWPTAFPLQSRIRADVHWFYVRKRNLYNEYKEYYTGGTVDKKMPYLANRKPDDFKNSSLMDYMNIPTVCHFSDGDIVYSKSSVLQQAPDHFRVLYGGQPISATHQPPAGATLVVASWPEADNSLSAPTAYRFGGSYNSSYQTSCFYKLFIFDKLPLNTFRLDNVSNALEALVVPDFEIGVLPTVQRTLRSSKGLYVFTVPCGPVVSSVFDDAGEDTTLDELEYTFDFSYYTAEFDLPDDYEVIEDRVGFILIPLDPLGSDNSIQTKAVVNKTLTYSVMSAGSSQIRLSDLPANENPFIVSEAQFNAGTKGKVPLNALPFRAYEQIYNAFFRDERNNPLVINGKPYYDKYLRSTDGGADTETYELHRRNWEQDFLTTALPSPQQGEAPLVGISSTGVMTLADENGNTYQAQAITADDNDTIIGANFLATNQDGTSVPGNVARSLVSYATSGISINDFRNVNALQRYLETNLRRGLKYRDLVAARWGVNISYSEMNMPEFIGGATEYVTPSQVNQTSQDTSDSPLGSYAGQLHCQGSQKHKIRHFCDEDGYIIGLVSVVPVPVYSQLLPKMFTKFDPLDFYQPEFGHIGMQPIPMKEVAPLQVALANGNQDETFGYQRAWYDYLARVDEVHGDMRGSLRDYVMYRTFSGVPRLGKDFLLVDHKPLDNVFTVQKDADGNSVDKIIGQIYVDAVSRRPIPRFGIPRLE